MGGLCFGVANPYSYEAVSDYRPLFMKLDLSETEVGYFLHHFRQIDIMRGNSTVGVEEVLAWFDLENTPFTTRLFNVIDTNRDGKLTFGEFVFALFRFLSQNDVTLQRFAFDLYDVDESGLLSPVELCFMLCETFGKDYLHHPISRSVAVELQALVKNKGSHFSREDFGVYARTHPQLLYHVFTIHSLLRSRIMGVRWWRKWDKKTVSVVKGSRAQRGWEPLQAHVSIRDLVGDLCKETESGKQLDVYDKRRGKFKLAEKKMSTPTKSVSSPWSPSGKSTLPPYDVAPEKPIGKSPQNHTNQLH